MVHPRAALCALLPAASAACSGILGSDSAYRAEVRMGDPEVGFSAPFDVRP